MTPAGHQIMKFLDHVPGGDVYGWIYAAEHVEYGIREAEFLYTSATKTPRLHLNLFNNTLMSIDSVQLPDRHIFDLYLERGNRYNRVLTDSSAQKIFEHIRIFSQL